MSIRILYLTRESHPSFRPDIATLFGSELPRVGVNADLVAISETGDTCSWPGGRVSVRVARSGTGRAFARIRSAFDLFSFARSGCYDAIQVRDCFFGAWLGLRAARRAGIPFFYWMSFPFSDYWLDTGRGKTAGIRGLARMRWGLKGVLTDWLLYHHVLPNAAHIFVQSDAMRGMLTKRGVLAQLMTPVPMGVSLLDAVAGIQPTPDPRLSGRRVLVYLGALERIRQPEIMLEAMVKVVEQFPDAILALVGGSQNAGDGAWLESEIVRLGLSNHVFITGWLPAAEAHGYLRSAEIGLSPFPRSPALEVASPTKVGEYLAFGLPVVANDQPDQAKLVHQTQGGLCVRMDGAGFAAGIVTLLADPVAAREMGQRGRAAIAALRSYPVIAERLAATYRVLLTPSDA